LGLLRRLIPRPGQGGLLDVYPVALGNGVHLFRDIPEPIGLRLVSSRQFPYGVNVHVYQPVHDSNGPAWATAA
jgi:hypothetical protein